MSYVQALYSPESRTPPLPLISIIGCPEYHKDVAEFFVQQLRPPLVSLCANESVEQFVPRAFGGCTSDCLLGSTGSCGGCRMQIIRARQGTPVQGKGAGAVTACRATMLLCTPMHCRPRQALLCRATIAWHLEGQTQKKRGHEEHSMEWQHLVIKAQASARQALLLTMLLLQVPGQQHRKRHIQRCALHA